MLCAVVLSIVSAPAAAQETTGTISGSVTDQTGAVLPGATVMVRHVQTGRTTEVVSNESGRYNAAFLQPGTYELTFSLPGFQPVVLKGVELHVNDRLDINQKMGVSQVSETVEVSAASQFVQPSPSVQSLLGPEQVQELPLNNRNFVQLATLVPGVSSDLGDEVGIGLTSTISISINGGRRNAVNWLVDGVSNVDVGSNVTLLATPTLESIQENPEIRDNPADLKYNNFGYTIGGPVPIMKDRFFFFFSEEWRRINRSTSVTVNVPQPAWLTDPTNANHVAPALRDPNAVRLLQAWPTPNASVAGVPRFINTNPNINNTRQEVLRLDYDVSDRHRLTGRYTHDLSETREIGGLFFGIVVPNVGATDTKVPGNVAAMELKSTLGQSLNEFKYQLSGNRITTIDPPDNRNRRAEYGLTIPELFPENNNARIPTMVVSGLSTFGANQGFNIEYWNHTLTDNVTLPRGNHTFKAGAMAAFEQKNENANNETQGRFTFNAGGGLTAFQNFLTGNSAGTCAANCTYSESQNEIYNRLRFQRYEMFVQDTWHIRPNVT
ncbi:MAG: carboxypeptidase-like regulatory domain-containing protein, partial [Acidobacteria bacterium]|nr:carboxypeptidase-like regulatory domain-containing protein [Acidobacteriota bacterium]